MDYDTWLQAYPLPDAGKLKADRIVPIQQDTTSDRGQQASVSSKSFLWRDTARVLQGCTHSPSKGTWQPTHRGFVCLHNETGARLREVLLPAILQPMSDPEALLAAVMSTKPGLDPGPTQGGRHVAVLLSADSAALGIWDDGVLARHKIVTGYTVRRKAGKAQLTYLRRGGSGGTVGGGIRSRESQRVFHTAASKLCEWAADIATCKQAHATGTVRVWNELYSAKTALSRVLPRDDARWRRVGLSVGKPRFADLKHVFRTISTGSVVIYDGSALEWMP
ncbi:g9118 [Coccomyxa elongata]